MGTQPNPGANSNLRNALDKELRGLSEQKEDGYLRFEHAQMGIDY